MWNTIFIAIHVIAIIAWLLLLAAPRKPLTHSAILYLGAGMLCLIYFICFTLVASGTVDRGLAAGATSAPINLTSIAGIRAFFQSDGGVVIGWTHYLAFDLFTGMWIARDADAKSFGRLVQLPSLFLTFMLGPIGLLSWLVIREKRARATGRG
jgi:Domain of unknown function (DUF4281)